MTTSELTRFRRRAAATRAELRRVGLAGLLVTTPENMTWLTGLRGSAGAALLTADRLDLLIDFRYYEQAAEEAPEARRVLVPEGRYDVAIASQVGNAGLARVGFEAEHLTVAELMGLEVQAPHVAWVPSRGLIERPRAVKDAWEIAAIRRAAAITSLAVAQALAAARVGMTEAAIADHVELAMRAQGAEGPAFPTLVASGPRAALPHPRPSLRQLAPGDWLLVDAGAVVDGYRADMTRSIVVGPATPRQAAAWEAVQAALLAGLAAVRPGARAADVDRACRSTLSGRGYAALFGHATGHGVGLALHEAPWVGADGDDVLSPGMVLTVEPGLYEAGVGGVRLEELVLVTREGAELLTTAPRGIGLLPPPPGSC